MFKINLRKVDGSTTLIISPAILDILHLHTGATVGLIIDQGHLIIETVLKPRYSLDELLVQCGCINRDQ